MPAPLSPARQRKLRRRRRLLFFFLVGLTVFGVIGWFLLAPEMTVRQISVSSLPAGYRDSVSRIAWDNLNRNYLGIIPGNHGVLVKTFRQQPIIQASLELFPELAWLSIDYDIPSRTMIISGGLRQPIARICNQDKLCLLSDDKGVVFSGTEPASDGLINLSWELNDSLGPGMVISQSIMDFITEFNQLSQPLFKIKGFSLREKYFQAGTVYAVVFPGWELLLDERTRPYVVVNNLKTLFGTDLDPSSSGIEYIDARFEDRVYYKLH